MYKPLSDSTLMKMTKKEIIEHLRVAERNQRVCEETINQQYENFQKLLECERKKTIDNCIDYVGDVIEKMGLVNATKYGNENVEQQRNSYSTLMRYEIADYLDDLVDELEQLKGE